MADNGYTPQELIAAFQDFEKLSGDLSTAYEQLQQRVTGLTQELASSREQQAQELAEKERLATRLHNLLDALPAGVVVLNGEGIVKECNPAALSLLGEPLLDQLWRDVVERVVEPRWDDGHDVSLANGHCVNIATQSMANEPGQILLITDVTETRRLQELLSQHKRLSATGEMAATLAHQIRTPLASALLYSSNLSNSELDENKRERFVSRLTHRLKHLEKLIEDMLLFSRGGGRLDTVEISIKQLLNDLQTIVDGKLTDSAFQLSISNMLKDDAASLNGNPDALLSVMSNLVTNSLEACGSEGQLEITVSQPRKDQVKFVFSDNGPGIAQEDQQRIFEPFVTTRKEGTGLGLAVVKAVIANHGGDLQLNSEPGKGASFVIQFPLVSHARPIAKDVKS